MDVRAVNVTAKVMEEGLQCAVSSRKTKLAKLTGEINQNHQLMDNGDPSLTFQYRAHRPFFIMLVIPFAMWWKINYMLVINARGDAWPDAQGRAVPLHCLGPEGQRLFHTLPDQSTTIEEAMAALEKHFVPEVNVLACRHTFRQRFQRAEETASQYVAALRALAAPCGFGQMEGELIRDQLIANAYLSAVSDKLLLEENLTLDRALTIACQVEAAVKNATLLFASTAPTAPVQAVDSTNTCFRGKRGARPAKAHAPTPPPGGHKQASGNQQQLHCFLCGSNKHLANEKKLSSCKSEM